MPCISIHALREEGDKDFIFIKTITNLFLSTPSARRATAKVCHGKSLSYDFYPRPPRGGRHGRSEGGETWKTFLSTPSARRATYYHYGKTPTPFAISIHALREEGDRQRHNGISNSLISIHALREEGDTIIFDDIRHFFISIHALREEGD